VNRHHHNHFSQSDSKIREVIDGVLQSSLKNSRLAQIEHVSLTNDSSMQMCFDLVNGNSQMISLQELNKTKSMD
jgi:hypothetical protein